MDWMTWYAGLWKPIYSRLGEPTDILVVETSADGL